MNSCEPDNEFRERIRKYYIDRFNEELDRASGKSLDNLARTYGVEKRQRREHKKYTSIDWEKVELYVNGVIWPEVSCDDIVWLPYREAVGLSACSTSQQRGVAKTGGICRHCGQHDEYPEQGADGKVTCWKCANT